jgi:CspA family cold shock protein
MTGTIKYVNVDRFYGFITPDDGGASDVFFHGSNVRVAILETLQRGQRVTYDAMTDDRGRPQAINVRPE